MKTSTTLLLMKPCKLLVLFIFSFVIYGCGKETVKPPPETGTLTDIDGNVYQTVKIGDQWWMAENLRVTRYRNGDYVVNVKNIYDSLIWTSQGAYCLYENLTRSPGFLYNYQVINNEAQIAPEGWHVPTDDEWKKLEAHLGMSASAINEKGWRGSIEGMMLKKTGRNYWEAYGDIWGTDEVGFSALPGGCRMFNNQWSYPVGLRYHGFWWTSSTSGENAWYRHLDYKKKGIFRSHGSPYYGFSIRCVKD